jgi:hypothetical protein
MLRVCVCVCVCVWSLIGSSVVEVGSVVAFLAWLDTIDGDVCSGYLNLLYLHVACFVYIRCGSWRCR